MNVHIFQKKAMIRFGIALFSVIGIFQPCFAASGFSDVSASHPNAEAISYLKTEGIVSGYSDGTYRPDQQINRAEFAKILEESIPDAPNGVGICPLDPKNYKNFPDVRGDDWFWIYVCMQEGRGIINGYPDGTFRPGNLINFVEAAKMLYGANHLDDRGILLASNMTGQPWFRPYVAFLQEHHAIPTSITRFDQPITRGEMAEMIHRLKANITTKPSLTYDQVEAGVENTSVSTAMPNPQKPTTSAGTMFVEESIGPLQYFSGGSTDYCGDIIRLKSSKCVTHKATYFAEGYGEDGIDVDISVHENLEENPKTTIADGFAKIKLSPATMEGNKVYVAHTYFGSYYYWLHDQKEILVRLTMICSPEFISTIEKTRTFEGRKLSDEKILAIKNACSALTDIASRYLKKYPSDL